MGLMDFHIKDWNSKAKILSVPLKTIIAVVKLVEANWPLSFIMRNFSISKRKVL